MAVNNGVLVELMQNPACAVRWRGESRHMQHCVGDFDNKGALSGGYGDYYAQRTGTTETSPVQPARRQIIFPMSQ